MIASVHTVASSCCFVNYSKVLKIFPESLVITYFCSLLNFSCLDCSVKRPVIFMYFSEVGVHWMSLILCDWFVVIVITVSVMIVLHYFDSKGSYFPLRIDLKGSPDPVGNSNWMILLIISSNSRRSSSDDTRPQCPECRMHVLENDLRPLYINGPRSMAQAVPTRLEDEPNDDESLLRAQPTSSATSATSRWLPWFLTVERQNSVHHQLRKPNSFWINRKNSVHWWSNARVQGVPESKLDVKDVLYHQVWS
jgi:hypothetical protein